MNFQLPFLSMGSSNEDKAWLKHLNIKLVRRAYQKTITLRVTMDGTVRVSCAKSCPMSEVNRFLLRQKSWVEKCLLEVNQHQEKYPAKTFREGEAFFFLGKFLKLTHQVSQKQRPKFFMRENDLILDLGTQAFSQARVADYHKAMVRFYKQSAVTLLTDVTEECSQQMQLFPAKVSFRSQKTRWGSCSSVGNISLNWRLVCAPIKVSRYVVIHELAHLKHQNHSQQFWRLVEEHCPEYKLCKKWLNENQFEFGFLESI